MQQQQAHAAPRAVAFPLPTCVVCEKPFDHGCNIAVCSPECEAAGLTIEEHLDLMGGEPVSLDYLGEVWISNPQDGNAHAALAQALESFVTAVRS